MVTESGVAAVMISEPVRQIQFVGNNFEANTAN